MKELVLKKVTPLLNYVILSAEKYTAEETAEMNGGIIDTSKVNQLKEHQTVISVSPRIKESSLLKEGDLVKINIQRYGKSKQKKESIRESDDEYYNAHVVFYVPTILIDGKECLKLGDNDIEYIVDEWAYEEVEKKSSLILEPEKDIINPFNKGGIILN